MRSPHRSDQRHRTGERAESASATEPLGSAEASGVDTDPLPPGSAIGPYFTIRLLGSGSFGQVHLAEHSVLGRRVAIKLLHPHVTFNRKTVERFLREARAVNMVRHPNVVDVYEYAHLPEGTPYQVMEFIDGLPMSQYVPRERGLSVTESLALLTPLVSALTAVHAIGLIHRDVKPSNVIITERGEGRGVKLVDFGIAKLVRSEDQAPGLTTEGRRLGTPVSMAPEQIRGEPTDGRTDVYGLGITTFFMLTGTYPFAAPTPLETEYLHLEAPPPAPSTRAAVPRSIDDVVLHALAKRREERPATTSAFLEALREAASPRRREAAVLGRGRAVYVRLQGGSERDGDAFDRVLTSLDGVEERLRQAGLQIALRASDAVLAATPLPAEAPHERLVRELHAWLGEDLAELGVRCLVAVHEGAALLRATDAGRRDVVGGPLLRVETWGLEQDAEGVVFSGDE
jgi:serine/threonine-protein kinase